MDEWEVWVRVCAVAVVFGVPLLYALPFAALMFRDLVAWVSWEIAGWWRAWLAAWSRLLWPPKDE
jgi:hypothetical protein